MKILPLLPFICWIIFSIAVIPPVGKLHLPTRKRPALVSLRTFVVFVVAVGLVNDPEKEMAPRAHSTGTGEITPRPQAGGHPDAGVRDPDQRR